MEDLTKKELNFLADFFSHWADPFREFYKLDIFRRGYPFGGDPEIDLGSLIRKKVLSESPDGHSVKLTDYGYELMLNHLREKSEWSKQRIIRINLSDKDEILIHKGDYYKAYRVLRDIFLKAQKSLSIQDPYISPDIFSLIQELNLEEIRILMGNKPYREGPSAILAYKNLKKEYSKIEVKEDRDKNHNRYIILDSKEVYQLGGSIKQLGDNDDVIKKVKNTEEIISKFNTSWSKAKEV